MYVLKKKELTSIGGGTVRWFNGKYIKPDPDYEDEDCSELNKKSLKSKKYDDWDDDTFDPENPNSPFNPNNTHPIDINPDGSHAQPPGKLPTPDTKDSSYPKKQHIVKNESIKGVDKPIKPSGIGNVLYEDKSKLSFISMLASGALLLWYFGIWRWRKINKIKFLKSIAIKSPNYNLRSDSETKNGDGGETIANPLSVGRQSKPTMVQPPTRQMAHVEKDGEETKINLHHEKGPGAAPARPSSRGEKKSGSSGVADARSSDMIPCPREDSGPGAQDGLAAAAAHIGTMTGAAAEQDADMWNIAEEIVEIQNANNIPHELSYIYKKCECTKKSVIKEICNFFTEWAEFVIPKCCTASSLQTNDELEPEEVTPATHNKSCWESIERYFYSVSDIIFTIPRIGLFPFQKLFAGSAKIPRGNIIDIVKYIQQINYTGEYSLVDKNEKILDPIKIKDFDKNGNVSEDAVRRYVLETKGDFFGLDVSGFNYDHPNYLTSSEAIGGGLMSLICLGSLVGYFCESVSEGGQNEK